MQRYAWYRDGVLNSFSIRALPIEWGQPTREEIRAMPELDNDRPNETRGQFNGPIVYRSWDLAEYSGVACAGNADCLVVERATKMLDLARRDLLWLPEDVRPIVEAASRTTTVTMPGLPDDALARTMTDSVGGLAGGGAAVKPTVKGDEDEEEDEEPDEHGKPKKKPKARPGESIQESGVTPPQPVAKSSAGRESITRRIRKKGGKYYVQSEDGSKNLGGPYDTEAEAAHRLGQIEYFKHKDERSAQALAGDPDDPVQFDGHGTWTVRDLDGIPFEDEATARRALKALQSPASFEAIFTAESLAKQQRNDAIIGSLRDEVRTMFNLEYFGHCGKETE